MECVQRLLPPSKNATLYHGSQDFPLLLNVHLANNKKMALVRQYRPVVAFDIGAEKSVVAAATERLTSGATLVPNEISKLSTPSAVSFRGKVAFSKRTYYLFVFLYIYFPSFEHHLAF